MSESYVCQVTKSFHPNPEDPILPSLFEQYERVIVESLITSFGLDFLIRDQHGGDVDTVHNVRQIGKDPDMVYKNKKNKEAYERRGEYNSSEYHSHTAYKAKNQEISEQKRAGSLEDAYCGGKIGPGGKSDLDHVISAKEIHDDRGRALAGLRGDDLANSSENLKPTNPHTNRTKKADSMDTFLEKHGDEYSESQKNTMRQIDANARKAYDAKVARAYYTSPKFAKDVSKAAANVGVRMGVRQALGFVFTEIWFAVKEEFQKLKNTVGVKMKDFLCALGNGIKRGFQNAKEKYRELFSKFFSGAVSGALSSVTTSLCNIFFTTGNNVVRFIRQSWASLTQALKILFFNPDDYTFGERLRAVAKVIATGASVVSGIAVGELIHKTPVGQIPVLGKIASSFLGSLVTGMLSCTLLYFLDNSTLINKLVRFLDSLPSIEKDLQYFRQQADYFEQYSAELAQIDLETFRRETQQYETIADQLQAAQSEEEVTQILENAYCTLGIPLPWAGHDSFDSFMKDKNARMVFE